MPYSCGLGGFGRFILIYRILLISDLRWAGILVQVTINRRLLIGRDGHLDQSKAYDLS